MKATRQGLIYMNNGWAQCPVVDDLGNDKLRIYFANRNESGESFITYIEVKASDPKQITYDHKSPIIAPGPAGSFDEHGQMPSCVKKIGKDKFLYYTGWSKRSSVPYENSIGIIKISGNFHQRLFKGPVISKDRFDPIFTGSLTVDDHYENNVGRCYKGYYLSCYQWKDNEPFYNIRSAISENGFDWVKSNSIEIELKPGEGGICSPAPYINNLVFCVRGDLYYRELTDKTYSIEWASEGIGGFVRQGPLEGLEKTKSGWDSNMQCYPYIINNLLFYNGNFFGRTGFGFAILQR